MVAEVVLLVVVAAVLVVWVLQETRPKGKVDQELQSLLLDPQSRMQVAAAVVVGR
jgi:hypothetical protein